MSRNDSDKLVFIIGIVVFGIILMAVCSSPPRSSPPSPGEWRPQTDSERQRENIEYFEKQLDELGSRQ